MPNLTSDQLTYIQDLILEGRKLHHKESCTDKGLCPRVCGCGMSLDLHTALSWTITDNLEYILRRKSVSFAKLRSLIFSLNILKQAVGLHKDHYVHLYTYLWEVYAALRTLEKELRPRTNN